VKMRGDEALQVDMKPLSEGGKQGDVLVAAAGMQDVIEYRLNEENAKGVEESNSSSEDDSGDDLKPVAAGVMQQTPPTLHRLPLGCMRGNCSNCTAIYPFYRLRGVRLPVQSKKAASRRAVGSLLYRVFHPDSGFIRALVDVFDGHLGSGLGAEIGIG
jgi:hypothetical protein